MGRPEEKQNQETSKLFKGLPEFPLHISPSEHQCWWLSLPLWDVWQFLCYFSKPWEKSGGWICMQPLQSFSVHYSLQITKKGSSMGGCWDWYDRKHSSFQATDVCRPWVVSNKEKNCSKIFSNTSFRISFNPLISLGFQLQLGICSKPRHWEQPWGNRNRKILLQRISPTKGFASSPYTKSEGQSETFSA